MTLTNLFPKVETGFRLSRNSQLGKGNLKYILILIFLFFTYLGSATTYYVSNSGNDSKSGLSDEQAWATISKVNSSNFNAGDSILFNQGDTWRERMIFPSSGINGNPIVISSYGTGNKPIFSSPILSASWTDLGSGRYSTSRDWTALLWEGSKQVAKATSEELSDGDWYHAAGVIYYRPTTGVPTDHVISYGEVYGEGNSIDVSDRSYITISDIEFNIAGIGIVSFDKGVGTNTIKIENCDFIGCWRGIFFMPDVNNNTNSIITNNYFKWCQNAIGMYTTEAIGTAEHMGHTHGINISPIISYNEMDACGTTDGTTKWNTGQTDFEAIGLQNLTGAQIHNNYIHGGYTIAYEIYNLGSIISSGNHFYANIIENNNGSVIVFTGNEGFAGFNDNWISYNIFRNAGVANVLDFFQGNSATQMNYFVNNTVYGENGNIMVHSWIAPAVYFTSANNIFTELGTYVFQCHDPVTDLVLSNNIYHQASTTSNPFFFDYDYKTLAEMLALGYEANSLIADPMIISSSDFNLQSGSPAINAGVDVGLTEDFAGNPIVGLPDIGAYEYGSANTDTEKPTVTGFAIPATSTSQSVSISSFTATDNIGVTGYLLTETSTTPTAGESGWSSVKPTTYIFSSVGTKTLYAWVKNAAGNVSASLSASVTISSQIASTFTFTGPSSGNVNSISANFTVTPNNLYTGTITLTPSGTGSAGISEKVLTFSNSSAAQTFTITPTVAGNITLTPSNRDSITNPGNLTYNAIGVVPDAPTSPVATAGNASATVTFAAPVNNGGSEITGYIVTSISSGGIDTNAGSTSLSRTIFGLTNGTSYTFTVKAINSAGTSMASATSNPVIPAPKKKTEYKSICQGEDYLGWTEPGEYQRTFALSTGGDSIVTTILTVNPTYNISEDINILEGESYQGWSTSGEYERTLTSLTGYDSIVTTNLTVQLNQYTTEDISICEGGSYEDWTTTGQYERVLTAATGADSIVTTNMVVNPVYFVSEDINILEGESYQGWSTSGQYERTLTSLTGCDSIITTTIFVEQLQKQSIYLEEGWNIFSTWLIPSIAAMEDVLENLQMNNQLIEVQDEDGNTYHKSENGWKNSIGELQQTEGYKIRVQSSCVLEISGHPVQLPVNIELKKGWNIISFPYNGIVDAMKVIQPLIDAGILEKVQDERGHSIEYWNNLFGWINGIGNFNAGEGYLVQVNENGILPIHAIYGKSEILLANELTTANFKVDHKGKGSSHMNIHLENLDECNLKIGDEIAAYDGGICVGAVKLSESNINKNAASIRASVSDVNIMNGFAEGNLIELRVWHINKSTAYNPQSEVIEGNMMYQRHASVFAELIEQKKNKNNRFESIDIEMFPNPANEKVILRFSQRPETGTKIILTDITGKQLIIHEVQSTHEVLDIQSQPAGFYLVKTVSGNSYTINKLIIN